MQVSIDFAAHICRNGITELCDNSMFNIAWNCQNVLQSGCNILHSDQQCERVAIFFTLVIIVVIKWCVIVILIGISLITNVKHIFMCILIICIYILWRCTYSNSIYFYELGCLYFVHETLQGIGFNKGKYYVMAGEREYRQYSLAVLRCPDRFSRGPSKSYRTCISFRSRTAKIM